MSSLEQRHPLSTLSTNRLSRLPQRQQGKQSLTTQRPLINKATKISNADKLKYRLKLAYYKIRTNQITTPVTEILDKSSLSSTAILRNGVVVKGTPSLSRCVLLDASTPLTAKHTKVVSFSQTKQQPRLEFPTFKPPSTKKATSFPVANSTSMKRSTPLRKMSEELLSHRPLKIDDLCNESTNQSTIILHDDTDATIEERSELTPVRRTGENALGSSPCKGFSTPGSYKAAKSLLELGLIN